MKALAREAFDATGLDRYRRPAGGYNEESMAGEVLERTVEKIDKQKLKLKPPTHRTIVKYLNEWLTPEI